jgi:DNA modification methylase
MALVLHGDCLEVMKTLPDTSVDLFVCDLPYGCLGPLKAGGGVVTDRKDTGGAFGGSAWDIPLDLSAFWHQVKRLCRTDHTPVLMFCTTRFGVELINSNPDWFRYDLVWFKSKAVGFLLANKMPLRSHEMLYVFSKKGATYYRTDVEGDFPRVGGGRHAKPDSTGLYGTIATTPFNNEGRRCVKSVLTCASVSRKGQHPTQKPDELYEWLITRYSKKGDTVLDPTAGSFASVFAAERLGRHGIGIEKDDTFFAKYSGVDHK